MRNLSVLVLHVFSYFFFRSFKIVLCHTALRSQTSVCLAFLFVIKFSFPASLEGWQTCYVYELYIYVATPRHVIHVIYESRAAREEICKQYPLFGAEIMFKDKYPSIFLRHIEAVVFIILRIFFETCAHLKIWEFHLNISQFWSGNIQLVSRLDQSRASKIFDGLQMVFISQATKK